MASSLIEVTAAELAAAAADVLDEHTARFLRFLALASNHNAELTIDHILINALAISSAPERLLFVRRVLLVADAIMKRQAPVPAPPPNQA